MSIFCFFGRHKPSLASIAHDKRGGLAAICEGCGSPIESVDRGPWRNAPPLVEIIRGSKA